MSSPKEVQLSAAAEAAAELKEIDENRKAVRRRLVTAIAGATKHRATQELIAERCVLSRQRISQYLKETRKA